MRTLVVVRSLKMGGMERVAVNLADAFAEAGHESHLMVYRKRDCGLAPEHPGVKVHVFSLRWWQRLTGVGLLAELMSRLFLNPLIRRSQFVWTGWLGGYLLRGWLWHFERKYGRLDRIIFRGIGTFELVWSYRDERARFVLENKLPTEEVSWRQKLFARCLFPGKHLVAVSRGVADSVGKAEEKWSFTPASLSVIVNPCPVTHIRELMVEPQPDIPDKPYIVNVARLVPQKDHALLLRAYAKAAPEELLVIVGDGPLRSTLEQQAVELGISEKVHFVGYQANPYPWMHHARLFVLSSRVEGMGIVLTEALACETPVISVDCPGGIREVLKGELENAIAGHNDVALAEKLNESLVGPKPVVHDSWLKNFLPEKVVEQFIQASPVKAEYVHGNQ
ncbi:Glycosyltransferase involved in cell wall bisynthesis [Modicisalibacter ilicicola DSM 19980]|uniref:Glycosyltransferase involved in cell wall bisynthesis n=2 Tax=Modicisalibacter ilicicola TaxID=480814 RepID=A0A1M5ENN2_9GAMM|nr:Glycosyltransferase involved in cell wall bisynthesis [Halomonas ilicicola DSM 19980]